MDHANFAPVRRVSQVPLLFFPYALSPVTPGSLSAAFKCRFTDSMTAGGHLSSRCPGYQSKVSPVYIPVPAPLIGAPPQAADGLDNS